MKDQLNRLWHTNQLTRNALLVALVVAALGVSTLLHTARPLALLLGSLCAYIVFFEYGELAGWIHYLVCSVVLMMLPARAIIFYIGIYGLYPVLSMSLAKRLDKRTAYIVRIVYGCAMQAILMIVALRLSGLHYFPLKAVLFPIKIVIGIGWIFVYDWLMGILSNFYQQNLRKHFIR